MAAKEVEAAMRFVARGRVNQSPDDALTAIAREKELKKWRRDWKIRLIEEQNPEWEDLYPGISN
jgi:predicted GIY-YIG superfamily endonuclease